MVPGSVRLKADSPACSGGGACQKVKFAVAPGGKENKASQPVRSVWKESGSANSQGGEEMLHGGLKS